MKTTRKSGQGVFLGLILAIGAVLVPSATAWHYSGGDHQQLAKIFGVAGGLNAPAPQTAQSQAELQAHRALAASTLAGLAMAMAAVFWMRATRTSVGAAMRNESQEQQIALIAKHTDNAALLTDADGRIQWANDAFTKLTGYALEELIGKTPGSVLQGKNSDPEIIQHMHNCRRAGEAFTAEILNYDKAGREFWMHLDATPVRNSQGRLQHFVAIARDVTLRRTNEQEILQYAQALSAAVDVNVPTPEDRGGESITASSDPLSRAPLLPPIFGEADYLTSIETIQRGGEQLIERIDERRSADADHRGTCERVECRLSQLLADIDTIARPQANEKGLLFSIDNEGPVPTTIASDARLLRHILTSLIDNSLQATEAGAVRVTCRMITPLDSESPQLALDVVDTGCGLSAELKKAVLAGGEKNASSGGKKNSLTICRRYAEKLGGSLLCESEPGVGSIFTLTVPTGPLSGITILDSLRLQAPIDPSLAPQDEHSPAVQSVAAHDSPAK